MACKSNQVKKLEGSGGVASCRYITRSVIAEQRPTLASNGKVIVALKTPRNVGTSHVVLSPMEFIGRLALCYRNRGQADRDAQTRLHGIFSLRSKLRARLFNLN